MKEVISELKELAWEHHAGFEDRLNKIANNLNLLGELEGKDADDLALMVQECLDMAQRITGILLVSSVNSEAYGHAV